MVDRNPFFIVAGDCTGRRPAVAIEDACAARGSREKERGQDTCALDAVSRSISGAIERVNP
jgi:hypothetical protein